MIVMVDEKNQNINQKNMDGIMSIMWRFLVFIFYFVSGNPMMKSSRVDDASYREVHKDHPHQPTPHPSDQSQIRSDHTN